MRLLSRTLAARWWAALAFLLVANVAAGCGLRANADPPGPSIASEEITALSMESLAFEPAADRVDLDPLRTELERFLAQQDGTYGLFVIDLRTGASLGINADEIFPAASTWKLPTVMYALDQVARGQASLEDRLTYLDEDWWGGTGVLQGSEEGDQYSLGELIELAITHSDNIADNMLLRHFGQENIGAYVERLGGQFIWFDDRWIGTTPREIAHLMRLAQGRAFRGADDLKQFLLDALAKTEWHDRAAAGVPEGVTVAHKIGTLPGVVNDVALVDAPEGRFIIAALSKGIYSEEVASGVIAEVTRKVYEYLSESES